jgi:hypothetical protein
MGAVAGLAGVLGGGYLLGRRAQDDASE